MGRLADRDRHAGKSVPAGHASPALGDGTRKAGDPVRSPLRKTFIAAAVGAVVLTVAACGGSSDSTNTTDNTPDKGKIVVGAANFAESTILANIYADLLNDAGYDASVKQLTTREVYEPALEKGTDIQAFAEYAATLTEFLNKADNGKDAPTVASTEIDKTVTELKKLAPGHHLAIGEPADATDQNSFAVTKEFATQNHLTSLEDLAGYAGDLVLGGPPECPKRTYCQLGLEQEYGIHFTGFKPLDTGGPLTKNALANGKIDIGLVFSSDADIAKRGFTVLEDPKNLQNSDNIIPVVNTSAADALAVLNKLSAILTQDELVAMNKRVVVDHDDAADVAQEYLESKNLLSS
jgi:osmoprotectant transport system substrate-binding protein